MEYFGVKVIENNQIKEETDLNKIPWTCLIPNCL